ncbi:MAG: DEAD/DEAH box helicase family protein [Clostridia bacterium]|nr:DEAD/DEAH box helicase family protein [Clostridia bacterium]
MSIELKIHQQEAYNGVKEEFENGNRAAIIHPTGTGKSYIALKLIEDNQGKKVLYLAPSISILHQIKEDSIKYNGQKFLGLERMTYQKTSKLDNEEMKKINPDIIVLDEFHHCGAPVWGEAVNELCNMFPDAKVLGLSATPIRYFDGNIDMAEEMFGNHIASEISFMEAIEKGILPEFDYVSAMYGYEDKLLQLKEQIENSNSTQSRKDEARKLFEELSKQLNKDTENLPEVLEKHITNKNGKYMVFCSNIEEMEKKIQESQDLFSKINPNIKIYSVASSESLKNNKKILKQFENDNNENTLKLIFSVNMLNEGYHLPDIDGVVMMRPTKSPTIYMQQIGRALTVGNSSKRPVIIDLVDNFDSIRVVEDFTRELNGRMKDDNTKDDSKNRKFKIVDYTKNIGEISRKIEQLSRLQSLSIEEKIDLFEKFINENPNEKIHSDTIFEGYPIGKYLIQIRQSMVYDKNMVKYSEEDKERLEKLGILYLYEKKDTIEEKIKRLKDFCEKYPYAFSNRIDLQKKFERDEIKYLEELYKSDYQYIINRKSRGKLPKELEQELIDAKLGGVFGLTKEDEVLEEKYGIQTKSIIQLVQDFGTIDNFRDAYIQYKVDLVNANTEKRKERLNENENISWYQNDLPLINNFDFYGKKEYNILLDCIYDKDYNRRGKVISDKIDIGINLSLDELKEKEKSIIQLRFGLKDGYPKTFNEVAKIYDVTPESIRQMEIRALRKLRNPTRKKFIDEYVYEPTEEFVKKYFSMHDVFVGDNEPNLSKDKIDELMKIVQEQRETELKEKEQKERERYEKGEIHLDEIELSTRAFKCLTRYMGGNSTIYDLIQRIEEYEDFNMIRNLGEKTTYEIIDKVHSLGFKFKYEEDEELTSSEGFENRQQEEREKYEKGGIYLDEIGLSTRAYNCLARYIRGRDIVESYTISNLINEIEKYEDFNMIRNLGEKTKYEIIDKVHRLGFKFKYEEDKETKTQLEILEDEQKKLQETLEQTEKLENEVMQAEKKDKSNKIGD